MKILKANIDLLKITPGGHAKGPLVAPYKDGIVFAIPNHTNMGYFLPEEELRVKCAPLDRMPFNLKDLDIVEESNRLVETNFEQRHGTKTIRQFLFAHDMLGEGVWLNAKYLENFERYTLYANPERPHGPILVTEGDGKLAGIIMPYNVKNQIKK